MASRGYSATKDQLDKRLARIEGQVRGVARMVEEDRYCIDVLTQIGAVQAALDKVALGLLDGHARHCLLGNGEGPEGPEAQAHELIGAVGGLMQRRAGAVPEVPARGSGPRPLGLDTIESQVREVAHMVGEDRYCIEVLSHIGEVQAGLDQVGLSLLESHARHCLLGAGEGPKEPAAQTDELMGAVGRLMRRG